MNNIYIFDFDLTLYRAADSKLYEHSFCLNMSAMLPTRLRLTYFKDLVNNKKPVYILTAAHPIARSQIALLTGIDIFHIYCRPFDLEVKEMIANQKPGAGKIFGQKNTDWKIKFLNQFKMEKNCRIHFYDDRIQSFDPNKLYTGIIGYDETGKQIWRGRL